MNNIFVGNLSFTATKEDVVKLFEPFGSVANAVIMERKKGKSRGYGFVDMPNEEEKNAAITALQGKEFMYRVLSVSPVIPKVKGEGKPKRFRPAKKEWKPSESKPYRKDDRTSKSVTSSEGASKYYSKFDGPPKPWRKVSSGSKPSYKKDEGSRPYYGKKEEGSKSPYKKFDGQSKPLPKGTSEFKFFKKPSKGPSKGFKMFHKVSGASKTKGRTLTP